MASKGVNSWSTTASNNILANTGVTMDEGQTAGSVNNSVRQFLADLQAHFVMGAGGNAIVTAGGTADALTYSSTSAGYATALTAYAAGQKFRFLAASANTGAATLNVDSIGAKTIKKYHDQDLAANDIESGGVYEVVYDGTNMQLVSAVSATPVTSGSSPTFADVTLSDATPTLTLTDTDDNSDCTIVNAAGVLTISADANAEAASSEIRFEVDGTQFEDIDANGVHTFGGNLVSDTDSTDDLGTTGVRWANIYVDAATITDDATVGGDLTVSGMSEASGPAVLTRATFSTDKTLALTDAPFQLLTGAVNRALTIPPDASVNFEFGTTFLVGPFGAGDLTVTEGSGVTLYSDGGATTGDVAITQALDIRSLTKITTNIWVLR